MMKKVLLLILWMITSTSAILFAQTANQPAIKCPGGVMVNAYNGNMNLQRNDLYISGRKFSLDMTFYYNSLNHSVDLGFGKGWSFQSFMKCIADSNGVSVYRSNGKKDYFKADSTNANHFIAPPGLNDSLVEYQTGKYKLITKHKIIHYFEDSAHNRMTKIEEPNGNTMTFIYTDTLLTEITDASGRSLQLNYTEGRLSTINDAIGNPARTVHYLYDQYENLIQVTDPAGNMQKYKYLVNGPMSSVTDRNGNSVDIIYYPNFTVQQVISCNTDQRFSYSASSRTTYVTEAVEGANQLTQFEFDSKGNLKRKKGNCCGYDVSYEYNGQSRVSSITDANGNKTVYIYDENGNLLSIKDPMGNTSTYSYEQNTNKLIAYKNRNGNVTSFTYDNKGNNTMVQYPMGITNSYVYSSNGDMISMTDGNGHTTSYGYDIHGNQNFIQQPLGITRSMQHDSRSRLIQIVDPNGNVTSYEYNSLDRLVKVVDALNKATTLAYDANGNLTSVVDRNNRTTSFVYDASDRNISITNPLNASWHKVYDSKGNVLKSIDPNGVVISRAYDNLNRLISLTNGMGEISTFEYDNIGNVTTVNLPNGNSFNITYDALNRMQQMSDNIGLFYTYTYDNIGNLINESDGNGNTESYEFDALNRNVKITDALGKSSVKNYDNNFNVVSSTDRNGKVTTRAFDMANRLTAETDPMGYTTTYAYDQKGNLIGLTDAKTNTTNYIYDALNRLIGQTFADGSTISYGYDSNGNQISRTDNNGVVTNFFYDDANRLLTVDYPGSNDSQFSYDIGGRLLSAVNGNATVNYTYDLDNRVLSETLNGKATQYGYNIQSNEFSIQYPSGRIIKRKTDQRGRCVSIMDGNLEMAKFSFDMSNRLAVMEYPQSGTKTNYSYDAKGRVVSWTANTKPALNFSYGYDSERNIRHENELSRPDKSELYTYDNNYSLIGFKRGQLSVNGSSMANPQNEITYTYDQLGNRITTVNNTFITTYNVNNVNAYTSIADTATTVMQYDANGNLINDGNFNYSYDFENRLLSVNNGQVAAYQYDALGRRVKKITTSSTTQYTYAGDEEIETYDNLNLLVASAVYGNGIDNIISVTSNSNNYYYSKNPLGSVFALSDASGNIVENYEYDPFGKLRIYDNSNIALVHSSINSHFFTGRSLDIEIEKYNYRSRTYDQNTGRFYQKDPLQYVDGMNMYAYVTNNSINYRDPFGTCKNLVPDDHKFADDKNKAYKYFRKKQCETIRDLLDFERLAAEWWWVFSGDETMLAANKFSNHNVRSDFGLAGDRVDLGYEFDNVPICTAKGVIDLDWFSTIKQFSLFGADRSTYIGGKHLWNSIRSWNAFDAPQAWYDGSLKNQKWVGAAPFEDYGEVVAVREARLGSKFKDLFPEDFMKKHCGEFIR